MTATDPPKALRRLPWPPPSAALGTLRDVLARGGVLVVPTESSYALAVDPRNPKGVEAVFALKGRGWSKPLPVAVASARDLKALGVKAPAEALEILEANWPARLTAVLPLVLPLAQNVPAAAGGNTLAVRVPEHPELCRLLERLGPLTVTSANRSGEPPILTAEEAALLLENLDGVLLDAGTLPGGPPSTLVLWKGQGRGEVGPWDVLRRGAYDPYLLAPEAAGGNQEDL